MKLEEDILQTLIAGKVHLYPEKRTLVVLQADEVIIRVFSYNEWNILLCLLESFPCYTSHEKILACVTNLPVEICQERLHAARLHDKNAPSRSKSRFWEQEFRPASRALIRLRGKLEPFGLLLSSTRLLGYILAASST